MAEQLGIVETKESLVALLEISVFLAERFKDGIGADDAVAIFDKLKDDEEFKTKVVAGVKGVSAIPAELKDISATEIAELVVEAVKYVPKIIEAVSK